LYTAAIGVVLFVLAHWMFSSRFGAGHDDDNMTEHP
jgi:hypothetical protein